MKQNGRVIVISGMSGAGKGTVISILRQKNPNYRYSVSATTRPPREGEQNGKDYIFITQEDFRERLASGGFIESNEYCNNFYGTPKPFVDECLENGETVLLELDVNGAKNVKNLFPQAIMIMILPPDFSQLRMQLINRGTETKEVAELRLHAAMRELDFIDIYDFRVINEKDNAKKTADIVDLIINGNYREPSGIADTVNEIKKTFIKDEF